MPLRLVIDPTWGYRRLDPVPTEAELGEFYESHYRTLVSRGGRGPDLARLAAGGPDADRERDWQAATLLADVVAALEPVAEAGAPKRALDVGCGTGELVGTLAAAGWDAMGTEPATELAEVGRARGLHIEPFMAPDYLRRWRASDGQAFGGITLLNVLEHVPDPAGLVRDLVTALAPGGRLVVRVPNDFNALQLAAQRALGGEPWWIAIPDHVNYFDHASIAGLLQRLGLEVVEQSADFPMELFLLMGDDYRGNPEVGRAAHERRRRLDLALDAPTRRSMGRTWAAAGLGRNAFVVAQVRR